LVDSRLPCPVDELFHSHGAIEVRELVPNGDLVTCTCNGTNTSGRIRGLKMSKSLKNFTTIRDVLSQKEWTARSLRICFLLMPWQDGIEVTDELMKAVVGWEGKLNNFFLKSLDILKHSSPTSMSTQGLSLADQQLLGALEKAKADVDAALCDSFNTAAVMRILSDLVTESNSAVGLFDQTIFILAKWVTRIVTIFGLDPEGDLANEVGIGWSGLDIPAAAKPYVIPASQLRDQVRNLACTGGADYTAIVKLSDHRNGVLDEPYNPYYQVLQRFRDDVKDLATHQAPAKDLLALCDQLRDVHLWNLGIYLEDRNNAQPALVRPLDKLLIQARAERESARAAKARAKLERDARDAEMESERHERAKVDPRVMFKISGEYVEWDGEGIPMMDVDGNSVSKNRRKKMVKEREQQKKRYEEWLAGRKTHWAD